MGKIDNTLTELGEKLEPRIEEIGNKSNGAAGEDSTSADNRIINTGNTQTGKKRGRPKKSTIQDMEWVADKPQEIEIPSNEDIPKPKRGRPSKQKKLLETKENLMQIFSVVSIFAGDIWQIDSTEAEMISKPLDSILSRYNLLEVTEKYGDGVSLVLASAAVFLPRIIFTINAKRQEKREKLERIENENKINQNERSVDDVISRPPSPPTSSVKSHINQLLG